MRVNEGEKEKMDEDERRGGRKSERIERNE